MSTKDWIALIAWIFLCLFAGGLGSWFSRDGLTNWYPALRKPDLNPPTWVFAPVWTIFYIVMGTAAWMVWSGAPFSLTRAALMLFVLQLALNFFWSILFFTWRRPDAAFIDLLLMWFAIAATIVAFATLRPLASILLVPYLAWVSFAGYLNGGIWRLNRPPRSGTVTNVVSGAPDRV
jgi:benzodiazapine receptor